MVVALVDKAVLNGTNAHQVYSSYAYQVSPPSYEIWNIKKDKTRESGQLKSKEHRACFSLNYPKLKFILAHFVNREEDYVQRGSQQVSLSPYVSCY